MTMLPTLNQQTMQALLPLLACMPDRKTITLHFANPLHRAVISGLLNASNKTPTRYPGFHADLGNEKPWTWEPCAGQPLDKAVIAGMGATKNGLAEAEGWHGSQAGAWLSGGATLLFDAHTNRLLAFGSGCRIGYGFTPIRTDPTSALPAANKMTAVRFFHTQRTPQEAPRFGMVKETRDHLLTDSSTTVTVTAPTTLPKNTGNNYILIGLNRSSGQRLDCDYYYSSEPGAQVPNTPTLMTPLTATAVFSANIDPSLFSSIQIESTIFNSASVFVSTATSYPLTGTNPDGSSKVSIDGSNPNQLDLNYPYNSADVGSATSSYALVYAPTPTSQWDTGNNIDIPDAYFYYSVTVALQKAPPKLVTFNICSSGIPTPPATFTSIKPLAYTWHCAPGGTQVTLADGSKVAIETLTQGDRVRTDNSGGTLQVEATVLGGFDGKLYHLVTDGGHDLQVSDSHVICTPKGMAFARDLQVGDEVVVLDGTARLTSLERTPYSGTLHNVRLGDADLRKKPLVERGTTLFANGLQVGDQASTASLYGKRMQDADYMLNALPPTHHQDYRSALADQTVLLES